MNCCVSLQSKDEVSHWIPLHCQSCSTKRYRSKRIAYSFLCSFRERERERCPEPKDYAPLSHYLMLTSVRPLMSSGPPAYKSGEFGGARAIRLRFYGADAENLRH